MNVQSDGNLKNGAFQNAAPNSASKDFEDFIYLLSHDVRNSVRALLELPQWIKEDLVEDGRFTGDSLIENFDLMEVHTRRLDRMLIDLLAYSRVGRNQNVRSMDIAEAVEYVVEQIAPPKGFVITQDLKCKTVQMGEQDIMTLLFAVISNAVKHHEQRSGTVDVSSWQDENICVICIQDDGPGIAEKYQSRVFDAMTILKPRDEVEGSGMGLAIVRKIVESYGGQVNWTDPKPGYSTALEIRVGL